MIQVKNLAPFLVHGGALGIAVMTGKATGIILTLKKLGIYWVGQKVCSVLSNNKSHIFSFSR